MIGYVYLIVSIIINVNTKRGKTQNSYSFLKKTLHEYGNDCGYLPYEMADRVTIQTNKAEFHTERIKVKMPRIYKLGDSYSKSAHDDTTETS